MLNRHKALHSQLTEHIYTYLPSHTLPCGDVFRPHNDGWMQIPARFSTPLSRSLFSFCCFVGFLIKAPVVFGSARLAAVDMNRC